MNKTFPIATVCMASGFIAGIFFQAHVVDQSIVVQKDIDATGAYAFGLPSQSPINGTIRKGANITLHMRKGVVTYVSVPIALKRYEVLESLGIRDNNFPREEKASR